MNRRELIATLTGLPFALKNAITAPTVTVRYGFVDVEKWLVYLRKGICLNVMFNGVDVTGRCVAANDKTGFVCLYANDLHGRVYVYGMGAAKEILYGDVRFVRAEPWA